MENREASQVLLYFPNLFSLFNLGFFHIFPIISEFSSVFSKSFDYSTYFYGKCGRKVG
jgi:hypothetical protein